MADIEKILDNLNVPKQIIDKSEQLLKTLFGQSFDEIGGIIADQVKLRRFKNQIKIFSKAQEILRENNIDPKKVSLKVLAPLIEMSSYEEDETLQDRWSKLVAHVLSEKEDILFHQNCISVLNKISSEEALLLDELFEELQQKRIQEYEIKLKQYKEMEQIFPDNNPNAYPQKPADYPVTSFEFNLSKYAERNGLDEKDLYFKISNLISLGLLKWETDVHVEASKYDEDPADTDIDVNVYVYNDEAFVFTAIGERFIKLVK
ncbi:Abi-alpha family protein [Mucilaginibacter boryungensis]|uniref:DUF4393 domain-containing protein n=1 Tax=Mucilaginibacter boryungensis TaxID=768480 RepID=A0ABR9XG46_9SPHI|nr:Abi-alpha family protein [Mucilaginibacter boryungensis]MBE9666241.1 DUF4393 domain-containing protein [Mucilaginibacter boryungensis]